MAATDNRTDILRLAEQYPGVSVQVSARELADMVDRCIAETLRAARSLREDDRLLGRDEAARMLGVSFPTLWRWEKIGYLRPVRVGGKPKYRLSDINGTIKIMEEH